MHTQGSVSASGASSVVVDRFGGLGQTFSVAIQPRKAGVMIVGTAASWLVFLLTLSQVANGGGFGSIVGALLLLWVGLTVTGAAVTEMSYSELADGSSLSTSQALSQVFRRLHGYLLAPIVGGMAVYFGLLLVLLGELLVSFLAHVPAGEILAAILFIPILLINMLALPVGMVICWLVFPSIASGRLGTVGAPFSVVGRLLQQPTRFVQHGVVSWVLAQGGLALVAVLFVPAALVSIGWVSVALGGDRLSEIIGLTRALGGILQSLGPVGGMLGVRSPGALAPDPISIVIARDLFIAGIAIVSAGLFAFPTVYVLASGCSAFLALWPQPAHSESIVPAPEPADAEPGMAPA
jgi:hypothetical protein